MSKKIIGPKELHAMIIMRKPNELISWKPLRPFSIQELYLLDRIFPEISKHDFQNRKNRTFVVDTYNIPNAKDPENKGRRLNKYETVRNACTALQSRVILIEKKYDDKSKNGALEFDSYAFIEHARYNDSDGFVALTVCDDAIQYLENIEKNYTSFKLSILENFRNPFIYSMYQILKSEYGKRKEHFSYKGKVDFDIKIEDLQDRLGISNENCPSYLQWKNFKQHILDRSKNTFSEMTDIAFEYKAWRKFAGRKYTHLSFNISELEEKITQPCIDVDVDKIDQNLRNHLREHYSEEISEAEIMMISGSLSFDLFHEIYTRCARAREAGKVKNFGKYLVAACSKEIKKNIEKKPILTGAEDECMKKNEIRAKLEKSFGNRKNISESLQYLAGRYEMSGLEFEVRVGDHGRLEMVNQKGEVSLIEKWTLLSAKCKRIE
jgi:plasmid replication initiation protein